MLAFAIVLGIAVLFLESDLASSWRGSRSGPDSRGRTTPMTVGGLDGGQLDLQLDPAWWSMAPDGSDRRLLFEGCCFMAGAGFAAQGPEWSPDGTQILLMGGTGRRLEVIDPETGEVVAVRVKKPSGPITASGPIARQPVP